MGLRRAATASLAGLLAALSGPAPAGAQAPEALKPELDPPDERRGRPARGRGDGKAPCEGGPDARGLRRPRGRQAAADRPVPGVRPPAAGPASAAPAPPAAAEPAGTEEDEAEDLLPARYVVLAIDDVHMEFESLSRVRKALTRFLDEDLRPEDQVALVTTSGASALSQEFTADRAVLQQTLSRLSAQGHPPQRTDIPYISEYQAELIEHEDPMALDAAAQEVLQAGIVLDLSSAEELARSEGPGRPHRGRVRLAADPRDAGEPVPRALGAHRPQGALPRVGRLPDQPLRVAEAPPSTFAASPTPAPAPGSWSTRSTRAASWRPRSGPAPRA